MKAYDSEVKKVKHLVQNVKPSMRLELETNLIEINLQMH
jgi:hypothetical protein